MGKRARLKVIGVRGGVGGMKAPVASGIWDFSWFSCIFRVLSVVCSGPGDVFSRLGDEIETPAVSPPYS